MPLKNLEKRREYQKNYYKKNNGATKTPRSREWSNSIEYKQKIALHKKEYRTKNIEACKKRELEYRLKNVEKIKERQKLWYQKNKKEVNKKRIEARSSNSSKKLRFNISALIREKLKRRLLNKNTKSTFTFLPYTLEDLISNLQSKFKKGMTWNNYGEWHIDHKIPDCSFDYQTVNDSSFQECWSLNNLQPLWAEENWSKGGRIEKQYAIS